MMAVKSAEAPPTDDDDVDEAGMDSFPASDPPSFWARGLETPR